VGSPVRYHLALSGQVVKAVDLLIEDGFEAPSTIAPCFQND